MNIGLCFGGYCPLHQGHLDIIMKAKKQNDLCYVFVCGFDNEPRAEEIGLPLRRRTTLIRKFFKDDEQIRVREINDTVLGIDESMSENNWKIWHSEVLNLLQTDGLLTSENNLIWYVGEIDYKSSLEKFGEKVNLLERINLISGTEIRKNTIKSWEKIAMPFRPHFSNNILITGTASEGKSTLTRDISRYFGIPYMDEYGRTYMSENCKSDIDLTVNDFIEFLIEQRRQSKAQIDSPANKGIFISDTDNLVTLMYAKAYVQDSAIDLSEDDYNNILLPLAKTIQRGIKWRKIYLLPPHLKFVDDGCRYMKQSSINERQKNYNTLVELLKEFGWWDSVEILNGSYEENFETVKSYIKNLLK